MEPAEPTLWLDDDATPREVKQIVLRAAEKRRLPLVIVSNRWQRQPPVPRVRVVQVPAGADEADRHIAENCQPGDLVVTGDVPLAALAVERGAVVLQHRGELVTAENVGEKLAMRNFSESLREAGVEGGGPKAWRPVDRQRFANALDRFLTSRGR